MDNQDGRSPHGVSSISLEQAQTYRDHGWWSNEPLGETIRRRALENPNGVAYIGEHLTLTWSQYDAMANTMAAQLVGTGIERGSRVGVFLPDGPLLHATYVACERAGVVIVGIPNVQETVNSRTCLTVPMQHCFCAWHTIESERPKNLSPPCASWVCQSLVTQSSTMMARSTSTNGRTVVRPIVRPCRALSRVANSCRMNCGF